MANVWDVVKLDVDVTSSQNIMVNHSGVFGMYGWTAATGVTDSVPPPSSVAVFNGKAFKFANTGGQMTSTPVPVLPGEWVGVRFAAAPASLPVAVDRTITAYVRWLNASNALISEQAVRVMSAPASGSPTFTETARQAPLGTATAAIRISVSAGPQDWWLGRINVLKSAAAAGVFADLATPTWVSIVMKAGRISTTQGVALEGVQDVMQPGTITATFQDPALARENSDTLKRGSAVRCYTTSGSIWAGVIEAAPTAYDIDSLTITLTGTDNARLLLDTPSALCAGDTFGAQVAYQAAQAGLPVIDSSGTYPTPGTGVVARDDSAKAADWARRLANTYNGLVWVDATNQVQCRTVAERGSTPVRTFSDTDADVTALKYGMLTLEHGAAFLTNSLDVVRHNLDEADDSGAKTYGPYLVPRSIADNGQISATAEIVGGSASTYATRVLAMYSDPLLFPETLTVDAMADVAGTLAVGVYSAIRVKRGSTVDQVCRVMSVSHEITAKRWLTTFTLRPIETTGSVPIQVPATGADTGPGDQIAGEVRPHARRARSTTFSVTTGLDTSVPYDVVDAADHITFDGTNRRFVVPKDGVYTVTAAVTFTASSAGIRAAFITVNGAKRAAIRWAPSATIANTALISDDIRLTTGDTIAIVVSHTAGGALTLEGNALTNYVAITYVGA